MSTLFAALAVGIPETADFNDGVVFGSGDPEFLSLISYARRSLGEVDTELADTQIQTLPMLYSGDQDGLLEGPTWAAYWTQNSYGTSLTSLPFLQELGFKGMSESQNWCVSGILPTTNIG